MRLRVLLVVCGTALLAGLLGGSAQASSKFPDLPGMRIAERVIGGRTPSALSTGSGGTQTEKASAPVSSSSNAQPSDPATVSDAKSIRSLPGGGVLPAMAAAARHPVAVPFELMLLAALVVVGWTKLLYALNRV